MADDELSELLRQLEGTPSEPAPPPPQEQGNGDLDDLLAELETNSFSVPPSSSTSRSGTFSGPDSGGNYSTFRGAQDSVAYGSSGGNTSSYGGNSSYGAPKQQSQVASSNNTFRGSQAPQQGSYQSNTGSTYGGNSSYGGGSSQPASRPVSTSVNSTSNTYRGSQAPQQGSYQSNTASTYGGNSSYGGSSAPQSNSSINQYGNSSNVASTTTSNPGYGLNDMDDILNNLSASFEAIDTGTSDPLRQDILKLSDANAVNQEKAIRNIINACLEPNQRMNVRLYGGIPPIVHLLTSSTPNLRLLGAHAIANFALEPSNRPAFRAVPGATSKIVELLDDPSSATQDKALAAISNLSVDDNVNKYEFRNAGLTARLIQLLSSPSNDVVIRALTVIVNSSFDPDSRQQILDHQGEWQIVPLLASDNPDRQASAAWAVAALTMGGEYPQSKIAEAGGIGNLVRVLSSGNQKAKEKALTALVNMSGSDSLQRQMVTEGAVALLVTEVGGTPDNAKLALQCLQNLAITEDGRRAVHYAGGVPRIVGILRVNNEITNAHALRCVTNLCSDPALRRAFVDAGAQPVVQNLLRSSGNGVTLDCAGQANNNLSLPY